MPQLIAMVIVVVGAMIYMFQTFGGTGDKIEGIAQKTSVMTEINNIRGDLIIALKSGEVTFTSATVNTTLKDLAVLGYFSKQMNDEIKDNIIAESAPTAGSNAAGQVNNYSAISFGGENDPGMNLSLIVGPVDSIPGIRVQLLGGLEKNAAFLEAQIASDLESQASIDRTTVSGAVVALDPNGNVPAINRPSTVLVATGSAVGSATGALLSDGVFTVYFKDLGTVVAP